MLPPPLPPQGISLASAPHLYSLLLRAIACYCCRNCGRAEFAAAGCLCQALLPMCPLQGREDGRIAVPANSGCCAVEGWKHVQGRHVWIARACQGDDFGWMAGRQAGRQAGVCVYKDGRQPHAAMAAAWFGQHKEGGELLEGSTGNGGKENMTHRGGGGGGSGMCTVSYKGDMGMGGRVGMSLQCATGEEPEVDRHRRAMCQRNENANRPKDVSAAATANQTSTLSQQSHCVWAGSEEVHGSKL